MSKTLIVVFVKNLELGQVKTRLAKTIGDYGAYEVYSELVGLTERITSSLAMDKHIYFTRELSASQWPNDKKFIQSGQDLGERMINAFDNSFSLGYEKVILIGSDLPDLNQEHIEKAVTSLDNNDVVFGKAEDGGYYLIGMSKLIPEIFKGKPWSQPNLLRVTLTELKDLNYNYETLETLNDIDTFEDLIKSEFYKSNQRLQEKIQQLND